MGEFDGVLRDDFASVAGDGVKVSDAEIDAVPLKMHADAAAGPGAERDGTVEEFDLVAVGIGDQAIDALIVLRGHTIRPVGAGNHDHGLSRDGREVGAIHVIGVEWFAPAGDEALVVGGTNAVEERPAVGELLASGAEGASGIFVRAEKPEEMSGGMIARAIREAEFCFEQ